MCMVIRYMTKNIKLFVLVGLLIGGCKNTSIVDNELITNNGIIKEEKQEVEEEIQTEKENLSQKVEYINVENGLLNKNNEFDLNVNYMLLKENNKKVGSQMTPTYIVIHNTANSAPAVNEAKYLNSSSNTSSTSFHFAVDDTSVYQTINMKYNSWHAGNRNMNIKSIGIEIAKSTIKDDKIKDKAIENGAKLTAMLMQYYNIPIERVITHYDVTGKDCPHDILNRYGFDNFIQLVKLYLS